MNIAPSAEPCVLPTDGSALRNDTRLKRGVYVLPRGLTIAADGITLDGNGATLVGEARSRAGVTVSGHGNVTIRNLRLRDYFHGIVAKHAPNIVIEHNEITSTAEVEANTVFLDIWRPVGDCYGGAILLDHVEDGQIRDNDLQHQMVGVLSYHCSRLSVLRNNASYCSGFGFHSFDTCDSRFENNWADYCLRYEPRDRGNPVVGAFSTGHMGADATGFLILHNSCRNVFRKNFARCGGDGMFLAGRTHQGVAVPCNDNLFEENDCSLSPNIAFEATFSEGNVFRNNWADRCNFGFWLGYSKRNVVEGNRMLFNRQAGIAVEHGVDFKVHDNDFQGNGHGILLWTKYVRELYDNLPEFRTVRDWLIERNRFSQNGTAIAIRADRDHGIRPMPADKSCIDEMRPRDIVIRRNDVQDNRVGIHLLSADGVVIEQNKINKNVEADLRREDDRGTTLGHNLGLRGAYL